MVTPHRRLLAATLALAIVLGACSDDPPTGNVSGDTTPPTIADLTPIDVYHIDVVFDEQVAPAAAENVTHYEVVEFGTSAAATDPGDPLHVTAAVLRPDGKTVSITTYLSMSGLSLTLVVNGVTDVRGNVVTDGRRSFIGSDLPDVDPPEIAGSAPAGGATGVPIGTSVTIRFTEPVDDNTFLRSVTWSSPTGPVRFFRSYDVWNPTFTLYSPELLAYDALQTILLSGVQDISGNVMPDASISFTTTDVVDDTPPVLVSSYPRDGATHVSVNTHISLTFSEPINRFDFQFIEEPEMLFDDWTWSNDGTTFTATLRDYDPLADERQYKILLYPGGVFDLGGRTLAEFQTITFSTGARLESGSIAGKIAGDPGTAAADPTGAVVIAESWWGTFGVAVVEERETYTVAHLDGAPYYVRAYMDTNDDGFIYIDTGDALGGFGADLAAGDFELESVPVLDSRDVRDVDFSIYDPAAVSGIVSFSGELPYRPIGIGLFNTPTDATNLTNPVATTEASWPNGSEWVLNEVWHGFEVGDYYLAAYIDADNSGAYEPGIDPTGVYGGDSPISVHLLNGADYFDIVIPVDYGPVNRSERVTWPQPKQNVELQRLHHLLGKRDPNSLFTPLTKKSAPQPTALQ